MPDIIYSRYNKKPARSVELPDTWIKCSYTRTDTNGTYTYDEVGRTDMTALIQSYAPTCDIKLLISRYLNGDVGALGRERANFTVTPDMSNVPTHMIGRVLLSNIPADFGHSVQNSALSSELTSSDLTDNSIQVAQTSLDKEINNDIAK